METIQIDSLGLDRFETPIVLDLGCGEGRHSHSVAWKFPQSVVIGLDLKFQDLIKAQTKGREFFQSFDQPANHLTFFGGDGLALPFSDNSFDCVICSEVLEHVPEYGGILEEIMRVLKPGGTAAISVPRYWPERICWALSTAYHEVDGGHIRIFKASQLENAFKNLAFSSSAKYYAHALHSPYWWLRCLFWRWGEQAWPCRLYHRLLVWDLIKKPRITRVLETLLNPLMGKSVVWHWIKNNAAREHTHE